MRRRFFFNAAALCVLALSSLGASAFAQETRMSADEIARLLSGNTVEGQWDGTAYKSYFAPDGTTIFVPANADPLTGKWRVNPESHQYESFFDAVGWTGYTVLHTDAGFAWVMDGKAYPFHVLEGRDLPF
ncbi:hypothetical protein [Roseovarius sp. M141]|uniref:hypothetical protein n=1 Tax=Roseovarius sp. M141 TaxID=2583806 RepID=UPI0020CCDA46|nr:hypothetical protein [Roseovarius sp. M141]MCQ0091124.1 hypothetical protein [Roseovarius sp. M141]